ncbi:MAG: hypothetical protein A2Z88_04505 [Omnitrophica WOR_2 bacterium GWA2_47_8]|nr:MAG: hypothetical protein A2Z88_04505 [Omnitrophica WOR_2 bacterium GWA2_47_8]
MKRIEANDKSGVQNMLSTLQRKLDERDKGVVKFDTVSHLERLLLVHFSDLEEKVVYYGDIALLSYLLKEETLPVLLKALANGQLTDEARRKGLVAAQKHEAFRGIEETVLRQELEIAYANLPIIIDDIVKDGKNILITLIEVKARRARARWMRGMVSQSDDPELVSGVIDWAMKKAGTTFTDSRAELARLLGVSSSLLKEIFSEFDIHTNPTRGRPTTDSDTGVGAPLKPLRFATYLAPAWKIATIKGHDYSVFRLPDQSQVILKYFKRIVAGAWQIPTSALNSRAAYELSHFLGFSRINASQIYAEEEGSFGAVEEYWGNSDLAEESFGSELSKAVDVVTALRSQADNYGQYVKIFGKSLVEGDVYRLFANHYDDSYKPTNIRVGVDAQGNPEIRWIDHDGAFAPDFSDEPLTQDQVLTYLKHRSAFIKEYASELVDKIAQLSDSDIEKISENVYGDETRGLLRNKMFENGASESEVQRTLQSLERFRMIFIRQAKERRETFSKFLAWTKEEAPGGIDFNAKMMDMKVGGEAQKIRFTVPRGTLPNINVNGFSPVIINITPVPNFMLLLGLSTEKQPQQVSSLN